MEAVFLQVLWVSLTVSAVLLPLLLAKGWLRRRVRAKALYVIWLLLALRLVIPADLSMPEPLVTVEAPSYQLVLPVRTPSANLSAEVPMAEADQTVPETSPFALSFPVNALLSALWLFGVLAAALVQGGGYLLVRRRLLRGARPVEEELEAKVRRTAGRLCLTRVFSVCQSGGIRTPMVLGLLRPVLLLPEGQPVDEVVLCHELTHLKRHDLLYKALLTAACWLHWFNPLVWRMGRAASENLELCCDGDVTAGQDAAFRRRYGELLLSTAEEQPGPTLSSRFGGSGRTVKERLANLFLTKKRGRALACLAVAAVALLGALISCRPAAEGGELSQDGRLVGVGVGSLAQENSPYVNREYGFALTLSGGWGDQVEIREGERGLVSFYMKDAGEFEDAGYLAGIFQCSTAAWNNRAWSNFPQAEVFLAQLDALDVTLYASIATDLPVDPEIPGALDRYTELSAQVSELLGSLTFVEGGAYEAAQTWLEEQAAAGMPGIADYPCQEGRVESVSYGGTYGPYAVYSLDYSLRTDRPDLVEEGGLTEVDRDGWVSRPYHAATGGFPYLLMRGGEVEAVYYSGSSPSIAGFWYTCDVIPQEERWLLAAMTAYARADALERLYEGEPDLALERVFSRDELESAGYEGENLPQEPWRQVALDPWITQEEQLQNTFQSCFSAALTQRRMEAMFAGPDAPYVFYEENLYFRGDVPCGPEIQERGVDWESFSVTQVLDQPDAQGIEFTLSGTIVGGGGPEDGTWTFRLVTEDPDLPQYYMSFDAWFGET